MNTSDDDEGPVPGLQRLALDREPSRDLWPGIEARLAPRVPAWRRPVAYAAAATVTVGLALHVLLNVLPGAPGAPVATATVARAVPQARDAALHEHDDNRLLVQANLKMVDDAERSLVQALKRAPDSQSLRRLLQSTRDRRRDLRGLLGRAV